MLSAHYDDFQFKKRWDAPQKLQGDQQRLELTTGGDRNKKILFVIFIGNIYNYVTEIRRPISLGTMLQTKLFITV